MKIREIISEDATAGATAASSIATVVSPQIAIGNAAARKKYGKGGVPRPPKAAQAKNTDGTAKNALDIPNTSLFGGAIKR
jgi:hypothetical protein